MTQYKYATEAGVNLYLGLNQVCQQEEFTILEKPPYLEDLKYYNIYFICSRNRVGIQPNFIQVNSEFISLRFNVWQGDTKFEVPIVIKNRFNTDKLTIHSEFPYNRFDLIDDKKEVVLTAKSAYVLDIIKGNLLPRPSFLDFEILYVGQAMRDSKKPAIERLISHDTLQKIYSENTPDKEIYVVLCQFIMDGAVEVKGSIETQKEYEEEDIQRFKNFTKTKLALTPEQRTTLAEAALIRYFQPKYNSDYKNTFPTNKHSSYDECYKLDLNAVSIEMNTELFFFSEKIKSAPNHFKNYYLSSEEDRRKLFDDSI